MRRAFFLLPFLLATGCVTTAPEAPPEPARERAPTAADLVGRWDMQAIYESGTDISARANPAGDRYIELRADGSFVGGGQPYGRVSGRWTYTPTGRELYLADGESQANDSRWVVTLRPDGRMEWGGTGSPEARRYRIVSVRAD